MSRARTSCTSPEAMYVCCECPSGSVQSFSSAEELEIHVTGDHLAFFPFECERCRFAKFSTEFALISHCKNDHGLREFYVRYKVTDDTERKRSAVRAILLRCMRGRTERQEHVSTSSHGDIEGLEDRSPRSKRSPEEGEGLVVSSGLPPYPSSHDSKSHLNTLRQGSGHSPAVISELASSLQSSISPHEDVDLFSSLDFSASTGLDVSSALTLGQVIGRKQRGTGSTPKEALVCQLCGLRVTNQRSSLVYHANTKHAKLDLYECRACEKTWQTIAKSDVMKHVKAVHDGDDSLIIDNRKLFSEQLKEQTSECFPPRALLKRPRLVTTDYSHLVLSGETSPLKAEVDSTQSVLDAILAARSSDFSDDIDP